MALFGAPASRQQFKDPSSLLRKYARQLIFKEYAFTVAGKRLLSPKYTEAYIQRLQQKYLPDHEDRFRKKLRKRGTEFFDHLITFVHTYNDLFTLYDAIAVQDTKEEHMLLKPLQDIALQAHGRGRDYGDEALKRFSRAVRAIANEVYRDAKLEARNAERSGRDMEPKESGILGGINSRIHGLKGALRLSKEIYRISSRKLPKYTIPIDRIKLRLQREAQQQRLGQDFLQLFTEMLQQEFQLVHYIGTVKLDVALMIKDSIDLVHAVGDHTSAFSHMLVSDDYVDVPAEMEDIEHTFKNAGATSHQFVRKELKDDKVLKKDAIQLYTILQQLNAELRHVSAARSGVAFSQA